MLEAEANMARPPSRTPGASLVTEGPAGPRLRFRAQRLQMYMVTSKPKRISVKSGLVHCMSVLLLYSVGDSAAASRACSAWYTEQLVCHECVDRLHRTLDSV